MKVKDDRGAGKQLKRFLPGTVFRALTVVYNSVMRRIPFRWKYAIVTPPCRRRAPYRFLRANDTVVQVGCARDLLHAGRSRAIYFSRMVPRGRVILIEADAENCEAVRTIVRRHRLDNIEVVECGAWHESTRLAFLSSPNHPASNLLVDAKEVSAELIQKRKYQQQLIDVDSIDNILARLDATDAALVSITTNGAELQIVEGMRKTIARGCKHISLASTKEDLIEQMGRWGYEYIARDDRGYCFIQKQESGTTTQTRKAA
jgi:FkbM family methyltransferase